VFVGESLEHSASGHHDHDHDRGPAHVVDFTHREVAADDRRGKSCP